MRARIACLALACLLSAAAWADNDLRSVEIVVMVRPDGKADVYESLAWTASGKEMHGFYFEGMAMDPFFNADQCYADLAGHRRVALDIKKEKIRLYDIVLAKGQGFTGEAMYFLNYGGDMSVAGLIGTTTSADYGELFYFDWAPEQWEEPLEHRTVQVVLPITVPGEEVDQKLLDGLSFLTETYVNKENKIDYFGTKGDDGAYRFTVRFHQENVSSMQGQRLQFYLKRDAVDLGKTALSRRDFEATEEGKPSDASEPEGRAEPKTPPAPPNPVAVVVVFAFLVGGAVLLYWMKARGYENAVGRVEGIRWAGDNWIPPKLLMGTYQVKGKVPKDLHPVEAALLLEWPLSRVAAIMLEGLKRQGIIEVKDEDPLQIRILTARKAGHEYEELFLQAFDTKGLVLSGLLSDFFEKVIAGLQEKIWDCDVEATKEYYLKMLEKKEEDETPADRTAAYYPYWTSCHYLRWHEHSYARMGLPRDMGGGYQAFMSSASCFKGCFAPPQAHTGGVASCYSACHNACHSACHSACVSGRSH